MNEADEKLEFYIQWKGTDVCMDLPCPCGYSNHYDGFFAHIVQCAKCKALYELPDHIQFKKVDALPEGRAALTCEYDPECDDSPDQPTGAEK